MWYSLLLFTGFRSGGRAAANWIAICVRTEFRLCLRECIYHFWFCGNCDGLRFCGKKICRQFVIRYAYFVSPAANALFCTPSVLVKKKRLVVKLHIKLNFITIRKYNQNQYYTEENVSPFSHFLHFSLFFNGNFLQIAFLLAFLVAF